MIEIFLNKNLIGSEGNFQLDIKVSIIPNKFVTVFGKSGSGKTTFLRMLAGLTNPDKGYISIDNNIWFDSSKKINMPSQKRKIGYVFQDYALFPNMTVLENLEFAAGKNSDKNYINQLLEITHLSNLKNRKPETLSGGQKQRVALARALVIKPEILLLDEPLSALDTEMRTTLQNELLQLHRKLNITTIMVSHDISEVFKLSDDVLMLEKGIIVRQGSPSEIFSKNQLSGKFKLTGEIVEIQKSDVVYILTVLTGNNLIKVIATEEEINQFNIGDTVIVASKAFNPVIIKV